MTNANTEWIWRALRAFIASSWRSAVAAGLGFGVVSVANAISPPQDIPAAPILIDGITSAFRLFLSAFLSATPFSILFAVPAILLLGFPTYVGMRDFHWFRPAHLSVIGFVIGSAIWLIVWQSIPAFGNWFAATSCGGAAGATAGYVLVDRMNSRA